MFLARRAGNSDVVIPASFRAQFVRAGWTLRDAPAELPEVERPIALSELQKVSCGERVGPPSTGPLPTESRRRKR